MKILFTFFFFCISLLTYAQKGVRVDYQKVVKNIALPDGIPESAREMILKSITEPKVFVLLSDGSKSIFSEESRTQEKVIKDKTDDGVSSVKNISVASGSSILFKNFDDKIIIESTSLGLEQVLYQRDLADLNWNILDEFLEIEGVNCQKAVIGKLGADDYKEAWFATEIPIGDGPSFFCGLPGLILKVESINMSFEAKRIQFEDKLATIVAPEKGKKISYEEYKTKLDEIKKNPVQIRTKTVGPPQKRL